MLKFCIFSFEFLQPQNSRLRLDIQNVFNKIFLLFSAGIGASLISSYVAWWKDDSRSFRFYSGHWLNDPGMNGIDKIGHFFTSYLFYRVQRDLLIWGGYSEDFSTLTSAILTFSFALGIETEMHRMVLITRITHFLQDKIPILQILNQMELHSQR
jgi:hypothetical protein